jgi:hypothetical protein
MGLDTQTPLYAARIDYETALVNDIALAAADARRRWKIAEKEIAIVAIRCERMRVPR